MSICSTPLTEPCRNELLRVIGHVTERELDTLLKTESAFRSGGFRARKPELVRKRLEQIVCANPEVSRQIRAVLAAHSRSSTLLAHLSTETIASTAPAWAALLGEAVFLIAALLDPRPELRGKAESWLGRTPHFITVEPPKARAELAEILAEIRELTEAGEPNARPATRESWDDQRERLNQRITTLQTENRRLKGVDDKCRRSALLLEQEQEKTRNLSAKLKESDNALRAARRELEETAAELQRETSRREQRLQAALDLSLSQEFHGWLAAAHALEAAAHDPAPSDDAAAFAENALRIQAASDRHSGNRAELDERLERLTALQIKVRDSLKNAIFQCPELRAADGRVEDEIRRLRTLLNPRSTSDPIEEALVGKIHAAPDNLLPLLKSLPVTLNSLNLLSRSSLKTIEAEFRKRMDALEALGVPENPEFEGRTDAAALLGRALAGRLPAILLLDGHNVLFGLQARYMPPRGQAVPDRQKRDNLIGDVVRITQPNPALRAVVLFDGPTRSDLSPSPNVRVIYSGGEGEHRADKVLVDQVRFFRSAAPDTTVLLVSNDNELCRESRRLGAQDLSVVDFGAFL